MGSIQPSSFEGFIRSPASVGKPLDKAVRVALNILFGIVTLGTVHIGYAIKHHFSSKHTKELAQITMKVEEVGLPTLLKLKKEFQRIAPRLPSDLMEIINAKMSGIFQAQLAARIEKKLHVFTLTKTQNLLINKKGQLFLENLGHELGKGTFKTACEALDLSTGERLVSLRRHKIVPQAVPVTKPKEPPKAEVADQPQAEAAVEEEEAEDSTSPRAIPESEEEDRTSFPLSAEAEGAEEEEGTSSGSFSRGSVGPVASNEAAAVSAFMAMVNKKVVVVPDPPQGTLEENERGLAFGALLEVEREFQFIRELQGQRGIATSIDIPDKHAEGVSQGEEEVLLQVRYDGDLDRVEKPGEGDSELSKAENVLKRMEILSGALEGLKTTHESGYIHRDIKPGNIMYRTNPETGQIEGAISDFGTVCLRYKDKDILNYAGTPRFSAPELSIIGSDPSQGPLLTSQSDIWSMGITMYIVLCEQGSPSGSRFEKKPQLFDSIFGVKSVEDRHILSSINRLLPSRKDQSQMFARTQDAHNIDLQTLRAQGPLQSLIADCLELDPAARPTAATLLERLNGLIEQQRAVVAGLKEPR